MKFQPQATELVTENYMPVNSSMIASPCEKQCGSTWCYCIRTFKSGEMVSPKTHSGLSNECEPQLTPQQGLTIQTHGIRFGGTGFGRPSATIVIPHPTSKPNSHLQRRQPSREHHEPTPPASPHHPKSAPKPHPPTMVLQDLGRRINSAVTNLTREANLDEKVRALLPLPRRR